MLTPELLIELACVARCDADAWRDPRHCDDLGPHARPRGADFAEADRLDALADELARRGRRAFYDENTNTTTETRP